MTTYEWADPDAGGDWNDPNNWEVQSTGVSPAGPPGAGDDVIFVLSAPAVITTDGATVASINGDAILEGDLTVTGQLYGAVASGGAISAGQFDFGVFEGGTLSVGSVSGGTNLDAGSVTADELIWAIVKGGTVSAASIDVDAYDEVVVSGGTVSAATLALDETYADLQVNGGAVTIASAVDIDGPTPGPGGIIVSGGQLSLEGGLTLDGGAYMNVAASGSAVVTTPDLTIGGTGSGRVFVGGSNARLSVTGEFILGESGSGLFTVENGGQVVIGGNAESAVTSGSTATGVISDAAANLTFEKDWEIGVSGAASWTLDSAGSATVAGLTELGVSSGGSGTLTISDAGTNVIAGGSGVIVGGAGQGTVTLQSGGQLDDAAGDLTLAQEDKSKGAVQITDAGSTLIVGGAAVVGALGSGAITLAGGAATFSGTLKLGENQGATGGLTVNAAAVTIAGDMTVGEAGTGSVSVGPDGSIGPGSLTIPTGSTDTITLGDTTTGKGTLTVSGSGASVKSLGLIVGAAGGGTLNIGGYGKVSETGNAIVGEGTTATIQKVTVTSAASWTVGDDLILGEGAIATTSVTSGGAVQVDGNLIMGDEAAATGILILSGGLTVSSSTTAAELRWGGVLEVGDDGTGNLTIASGAAAKPITGGDGVIEIASAKGAKGTVAVSGATSELIADSLAVGGTLSAAGGAGSLSVGSGGAASLAGGGVMWSGGQATIEGELSTAGAFKVAGGVLTVGGASSGARLLTGAGTLALTGGTTAFDAGAALTVAKVTETGTAAVTLGASLKYAGVWDQVGGATTVGAGDIFTFTGTGDSFTGILTGDGTVNFAAGTDSLSGVTLSAASTVINGAAVTLASVIDLTKTLTVTTPNLLIASTGASLTGGGTLSLSSLATNRITGVTPGAALTNDDKIAGAGDIGGGSMTLTNGAPGDIIGDSAAVALTLDTGSKTISNAGLIISEGKGGVTIKSAVDNTGRLEVTTGTLTVSGAVTGTGLATIGGGTADFLAAFSQNVAFTGTSGVLELAKSQSYAGEISGFSLTGGTSLDLGDIGFTSGKTKASFVENSAKTSGVLTVTDGTHTAKITLAGDYASSTFTTSSDGHGGTIVVDPARTPAVAAPRAAGVLSFIAAMAGFEAGGGDGMIPTPDSVPSPHPMVSVPQLTDSGLRPANWG